MLPQDIFLPVVEDVQVTHCDSRGSFIVGNIHGAELDSIVLQTRLHEDPLWFYLGQIECGEEVLKESPVDFSKLRSCIGACCRVVSLFRAELDVAEEEYDITNSSVYQSAQTFQG